MKRARAERTDLEREVQAMREHQLRVEWRNLFLQEVPQKLEQLYSLWKAAGFPFVPKRTYQPNVLWELHGVEGGLSLLCRRISGSIVADETYHRLVMSKSSAALHYIKETPGSCSPQFDCPLDVVYEIVSTCYSGQDFRKNLDEVIEILTSFNQRTVQPANEQSQQ